MDQPGLAVGFSCWVLFGKLTVIILFLVLLFPACVLSIYMLEREGAHMSTLQLLRLDIVCVRACNKTKHLSVTGLCFLGYSKIQINF